MLKPLSALSANPLLRNIITLASGTALAQLITMGFAPLITRLYGPEAFGVQSIFVSMVLLLGTVSALGYPTAIVLPKKDTEAIHIAKLAVVVSLLTALLITCFLAVVGEQFLTLLNAQAIGSLIFLLPVATLFSALSATFGQWLVRNKAFRLATNLSIFSSGFINLTKAGFGFYYPSVLVLILANIFGGILSTALAYWTWLRFGRDDTERSRTKTTRHDLRAMALKYRDFPLLRTPQNLINAISRSLPLMLLAAFFGAGAAGQYAIAMSVLAVPAALIGGSVMSVFYPRITEAVHDGEDVKALIVKATASMALAGIIPYLAVVLAGPILFKIVFGAQWQMAGEFAQWLSPWLFFQFINKPAVAAVPALKLQGGLLIYEIFSTGTKLIALWLGFVVFQSAIVSVALFSVFGVVAYIWLILWVIRRSHHANRIGMN